MMPMRLFVRNEEQWSLFDPLNRPSNRSPEVKGSLQFPDVTFKAFNVVELQFRKVVHERHRGRLTSVAGPQGAMKGSLAEVFPVEGFLNKIGPSRRTGR